MAQKIVCRGVDIIVPVYRDLLATQRCIESVLASDIGPRRNLIVIEDASPEPDVEAYCQRLKARAGVTVLNNIKNKGFVATVNMGMEVNTTHDVVLLNSDTEVAGDWLFRLQTCAYREENTGTVTPFSNNATICSYPNFIAANPLPEDYNTAQLSALFGEVNDQQDVLLPTAVGFCMYIRRDCLNNIGYFDVESFGLGYGEECDFSMRAAAAGWQNKLAADVFVYHEGGISFGDATHNRKVEAEKIMAQKHPHYEQVVAAFISEDPLLRYRNTVDSARSMRGSEMRIAVCLAAYNGMEWLPEQLSSILAQQEVCVTVFVSVDPSEDGTREWVQGQAEDNTQLELLPAGTHTPSAGQNFFRLCRDIDFSDFDYISFSDQDDIWFPNKLAQAISILKSTECAGYSSNVRAMWGGMEKTATVNKAQPQVAWDFLFEAPGPGCTFVFTRSLALRLQQFLQKNKEKMADITSHDWFIYAYARRNGYPWHIDPTETLLYRQHDKNTLGANQGLQAGLQRWQAIRDQSWLTQIISTTEILDLTIDPFIKRWYPVSRIGFFRLALQARHCRRRRREKVIFALIAFYWGITGQQPRQRK